MKSGRMGREDSKARNTVMDERMRI
jgi:hypothetical protein